MVGRILIRQIERYFEPQLPGSHHELLEVFQRPQLRVDGFVTAFACADRPGAAHVIRQGRFIIVLSLPIHAADGMNGRKVDNVETHPGNVIQPIERSPAVCRGGRVGATKNVETFHTRR